MYWKKSERYKNMIKFRDILNNNPHILKEYEYFKKKNYQKNIKTIEQSHKKKNGEINDNMQFKKII